METVMKKKIIAHVISNVVKMKFPLALAPVAILAMQPMFVHAAEETVDEVIVTGTANGEAMRKLDASFAISTVTADDIKQVSPASTADLLKTVPGVWVESSGGVAGANVFVRG